MFFDQRFSEIGRSTGQHLDAVRRQLGVGIDPGFDYTQMEESRKKWSEKKKEKRQRAQEEKEASGPVSGLDQLRKALREVVGGGGAAEEPEQPEEGGELGGGAIAVSPGVARAQREHQRPSAAFLAASRDHLARLDLDAPGRFRAPPMGTYRPRDDLCQPRVCGAGPGGDFGIVEGRSFKPAVEEREPVSVETLEDTPERPRRRAAALDFGRSPGRQDIVKSGGITFHVNSFTAGVLDGDLVCSHMGRTPSWDFAKLSAAEVKLPETYFQPGQYSVNMETVRPRLDPKNIGFDKQRARKPLREFVGRVEVDERLGSHLPDRSLSRSCGLSLSRSVPILSKELRVMSPSFDKYTSRPQFFDAPQEHHQADDPVVDQKVLHRSMTFDAVQADKPLRPRTKNVERFERVLKREESLKIQRAYASDICLARKRDNETRGPVSVELLSDVDSSPSLRKRVTHLTSFERMDGRDPERRCTESPPRNRDPGAALRFERAEREGDAGVELGSLSPLAGSISKLRAARTYDPDDKPVSKYES